MSVVVGLDVSKRRLDAAIQRAESGKWYDRKVENSEAGVVQLLERICAKLKVTPKALRVVMEATGPYHENAAVWLHARGCEVCVANPKRVRDFAKGMGLLNKTDRADARALAQYGIHADLHLWTPPPPEAVELKALLNRLSVLKKERGRECNRLEKAQAGLLPDTVLASIHRCIASLDAEIKRINDQIDDHFDQHPGLREDKKLLDSIPGIGRESSHYLVSLFTAREFSSARQAAAFVGLSVVHHDSGSSVRGKPHLSKKGSGKLRSLLYMAALAAVRHNPALKGFYQRLKQAGKPAMAAIGAVMRKLVHIAFGVHKHRKPFNPQLACAAA